MDSWEGTVAHPTGDWSSDLAGPPLSSPEPKTAPLFSGPQLRPVGRRGHRRRGPNDYESARLDEPKNSLGLSSETDSLPQDWLAQAEQGIDHSRSERGKLERYPIRDRSCDVLRVFQSPGVVRVTFLSENRNRRTVGEASCVMGSSRRKTFAWEGTSTLVIAVGDCVSRCGIDRICISSWSLVFSVYRIETFPVGYCEGRFAVLKGEESEAGRGAMERVWKLKRRVGACKGGWSRWSGRCPTFLDFHSIQRWGKVQVTG